MPEIDIPPALTPYQITSNGLIAVPISELLNLLNQQILHQIMNPLGGFNNGIDRKYNFQENQLLSEDKAREYLKCSTPDIYKLRSENRIIWVQSGKHFFYQKSSLDNYLATENEKEVSNEL